MSSMPGVTLATTAMSAASAPTGVAESAQEAPGSAGQIDPRNSFESVIGSVGCGTDAYGPDISEAIATTTAGAATTDTATVNTATVDTATVNRATTDYCGERQAADDLHLDPQITLLLQGGAAAAAPAASTLRGTSNEPLSLPTGMVCRQPLSAGPVGETPSRSRASLVATETAAKGRNLARSAIAEVIPAVGWAFDTALANSRGAQADGASPLTDLLPSLSAVAGAAVTSADPAATGRAAMAEAQARLTDGSRTYNRVGTAQWNDEIAARLTLMIDRGEHVATLKLSPEHLGPLEVRVTVREGDATVWFGAAHADTRTALESAMPRLRELLGTSGLSLTSAGVSGEPPRDTHRGHSSSKAERGSRDEHVASDSSRDSRSVGVATIRMLDLYA